MESFGVLFPLALVVIIFAFYLLRRSQHIGREAKGAWYSLQGREIQGRALGVSLQAAALFVLGGIILIWLLINLPQGALESKPEPASTNETILTSPLPPPVRPTEDLTSTLPADAQLTPGLEGQPGPAPIATVPLTSQAIITNTNGNGLLLRDAPFGNQVVILPEGDTIYVRGGLTEVQGIMWQSVVTMDGREGWVAADYLIYR